MPTSPYQPPMGFVWVFHGEGGTLASGAFLSRSTAEEWITRNRLSGVLTAYPADVAVYDWMISNGQWRPSNDYQAEPAFIQRFTSAYLEHYHYQDGVCRT
jgi:hypothetical protein